MDKQTNTMTWINHETGEPIGTVTIVSATQLELKPYNSNKVIIFEKEPGKFGSYKY